MLAIIRIGTNHSLLPTHGQSFVWMTMLKREVGRLEGGARRGRAGWQRRTFIDRSAPLEVKGEAAAEKTAFSGGGSVAVSIGMASPLTQTRGY